jgi:WhiB family redox-sensing transcriptional regulator
MTDWTVSAACRDWANPDDWHQPRGVGTREMRALCNACEVNVTCLDWAIRHEQYGYWAGTTEEQREEFRRRKSITLGRIDSWEGRRPPQSPECGSVAAAARHRERGEPVDEMCSRAVRDAERKRRNYRDAKENRETA